MTQNGQSHVSSGNQFVDLLTRLNLLRFAYLVREVNLGIKAAYTQKVNPFRPPSSDGMPLPNLWLMVKVAGHGHINSFLRGGKLGVEVLQNTLKTQNLSLEDFHVVLDFGCGVGRITRHLKPFTNLEIHGCDYNPALIAWCQKNLPFATFEVNKLAPPLPYPDAKFDLLFAFSVFTHLDEKLYQEWIHELARVLKPGGYLIFTIMGEAMGNLHKFTEDEWQQFNAGKLVVRYSEVVGMNLTGAFCGVDFVKTNMTKELEFVNHIPEGALANPPQDVVLMRKPSKNS